MKMLKNLKIKTKLGLLFGLVIILSTISLLYNLFSLYKSKELIEQMKKSEQGISYLLEADRDAYQSSIAISQLLERNFELSAGQTKKLLSEIIENKDQIKMRYEKFVKIFDTTSSKEYTNINNSFLTNYNQINQLTLSIVDFFKEQNFGEASLLYHNEYLRHFGPMRDSMNSFTDIHEAYSDKLFSENVKIINQVVLNSIILFSSILTILILNSYLIFRTITTGLNEVLYSTERISQGILTDSIPTDREDEFGQMLNSMSRMSNKLKEIANTIKSSSQNFFESSQQISSSSQHIADGAIQQAASSEEISASIQQISASINSNSDNARQTEIIANQAVDNIRTASQSVTNTLNDMKQILQKVSIIREISEKTDFLAVNAAIEAARAGEMGMGFAVVSTEIRKLAERSQIASKDIDELSMSNIAKADQSAKLLAGVVPEIQSIAQKIQEISAASNEQNVGAAQISESIQQLSQIIQGNAAHAEELASSSDELTSQASMLLDSASFFKTDLELLPTNFIDISKQKKSKSF